MKIGSLFDGIGGWPLAAVKCGFNPVWSSEIENFPVQVTARHFPNMVQLGDITKIDGTKIEPVDIITFGSPCQDLSIAGKRGGLEGARSGLFNEAVRIIREMRLSSGGKYPRFAIWENVPGAFSSNKGLDFRTVLEEITETKIPMPRSKRWATAGMVRSNKCEVAWRVLDAQYWGVPQRRKRIFLVADLGGRCAGEILFKPESVSRYFAEGCGERERVAGSIADSIRDTDTLAFNTTQITSPKNGNNPQWNDPCHCLAATDQPPAIIFKSSMIDASTQDSIRAAECYPLNTQVITRHKSLGRGTGFGVGKNGDPAYTLQAGHSHAVCAAVFDTKEQVPILDTKMNAAVILRMRSGKEGGGKGALLSEEKSLTLATGNDQVLFSCGGFSNYKQGNISATQRASMMKQTDVDLVLQSIIFEPRSPDGTPSIHENGICPTLNTAQGGQRQPCIAYCIAGNIIDRKLENGGNGKGVKEEVSYTLNTIDRRAVAYSFDSLASNSMKSKNPNSGGRFVDVSKCLDTFVPDPSRNQGGIAILQPIDRHAVAFPSISYSEFTNSNKASTLKACGGVLGDGSENLAVAKNQQNYKVRRLTPTECDRLQGLPENWTAGGSDTARYKALGNGMAQPCPDYVMQGIAEILKTGRS